MEYIIILQFLIFGLSVSESESRQSRIFLVLRISKINGQRQTDYLSIYALSCHLISYTTSVYVCVCTYVYLHFRALLFLITCMHVYVYSYSSNPIQSKRNENLEKDGGKKKKNALAMPPY